MNVHGTIGRPAPHDPRRDTEMTFTQSEPAARREQNRTTTMHLIPEALARSQMQERIHEAESQRLVRQLALAARLQRKSRRLQRRADRASRRARRAMALAVMQ
ncbi:hypothetical protein RM780_11900 [Streptomyces sp. DSM 44917]|uniref:Uncharacterized protein n=1 Tax=Streptomyces boetiae TaxID=3075541 RepID=A0ABU2L834_9ACTN|nr:hypothetical protein [Streptomyces sp. DSM 44917]MDT0307662.1 hypothetical protein [Streptomyces sp. DSM 44917]